MVYHNQRIVNRGKPPDDGWDLLIPVVIGWFWRIFGFYNKPDVLEMRKTRKNVSNFDIYLTKSVLSFR